jgi:hypothetical protein
MVGLIAFGSPDTFVITDIRSFNNSTHLSNIYYRDYSCYRDKVYGAAGLHTAVMVFAEPSGEFYLDVTNHAHFAEVSL